MSAKHILIIDDEADIREVAQVSLEMVGGWQVSVARSGPEGIALARAVRPDAILLDVMMPDMDGPATFSKLQEDPASRGIPVILLTARVTPGQPSPFAGLGVAAVIGKPFDPMTLANQVSRALGWEA
jgi:CheY-like chemotaxis protein